MTEEDARLALLQTEITTIESAISRLDTIVFQIKGWCVTASLAIGGVAVAYHKPALLAVGAAAVIGFYLLNCQFKLIQRSYIDRNKALDAELRSVGIMPVLRGEGSLPIVGTFVPTVPRHGATYLQTAASQLPAFWREARLPNSFSLYVFILACLAAEAITLG
jgi:hypothetical protein